MTTTNHIGYFAHLVDQGKMTEEEANERLKEMHEIDMQQDAIDRYIIESTKHYSEVFKEGVIAFAEYLKDSSF